MALTALGKSAVFYANRNEVHFEWNGRSDVRTLTKMDSSTWASRISRREEFITDEVENNYLKTDLIENASQKIPNG